MKRHAPIISITFMVALCLSLRLQGSPALPDEISLSNNGCFGSCPVDKLTLRNNGEVVYYGWRYTSRVGRFQGSFPKAEFERLSNLLSRQRFASLNEQTLIPDASSRTIETVSEQKKHEVTFCPKVFKPLDLISTEIEKAANTIRWDHFTGIDGKIMASASLKQGHTQLRSPSQFTVWTALAPSKRPKSRLSKREKREEVMDLVGRGACARCNASGRFQFALPPGRYVLMVFNNDYAYGVSHRAEVDVPKDKLAPVTIRF